MSHTYFIFTSDHGYRFGEFRMPQGKWNVYENNIRVPMVFVGPGVTAGGTFDQIGSNVDIMPTILGLAGVATPGTMDGRSVAPELIKKDASTHTQLPAQTLLHLSYEWARKEAGSRPAWRTCLLIEYYGLGNVVRYNHLEDTFNNTFRRVDYRLYID
jgi:N-acetylglucosamine-6-sulfatase